MYYVKHLRDAGCWTVGLDTSHGWHPVEDFGNPEEAQACADRRNGIQPPVMEARQTAALERIAAALESIVEALHNRDGVNIADNSDILCAELVSRLSPAA